MRGQHSSGGPIKTVTQRYKKSPAREAFRRLPGAFPPKTSHKYLNKHHDISTFAHACKTQPRAFPGGGVMFQLLVLPAQYIRMYIRLIFCRSPRCPLAVMKRRHGALARGRAPARFAGGGAGWGGRCVGWPPPLPARPEAALWQRCVGRGGGRCWAGAATMWPAPRPGVAMDIQLGNAPRLSGPPTAGPGHIRAGGGVVWLSDGASPWLRRRRGCVRGRIGQAQCAGGGGGGARRPPPFSSFR